MIRHAPSIGLGLGLSLRSDTLGAPGLLDLYGGAAAAYSLRALSRGWLAGDVVEVRSSAGGDPASFTASQVANGTLEAWVGVGNDGFVTTWYDQSGNANDATQIATASQPKIVDAGALVTGGLDFDGVDDSFGMSNLFSGTTAVAQFAVGNADTTGTAEAIIGQGSLSSPLGGAWHVTSEIAFRCAGNSIYDDDFIDANLLLLSTLVAASSTSADVEMFLDGVALGQTGTSSTALDFTTSSANIGVSSGGAYYDGRIAEIIVYDSDQTANRVGIETNINDHYSIYA